MICALFKAGKEEDYMEYQTVTHTKDGRTVVYLPPETYTGHALPITYTTHAIYEVDFTESENGWQIGIRKEALPAPITHTPEEYDFPDKLYEPYWEKAEAYGIFSDAGELIGAIEICVEEWSHRMRVTELWVSPTYHKRGYGHTLLSFAKDRARSVGCRALILETQSCNVNAVDFYRHEGLSLIGFDRICYSNRDISRKEVRLEMGILFDKNETEPHHDIDKEG